MAMWEKETCYPLLYLCEGIQKEIKEYRDTNYAALIADKKKKLCCSDKSDWRSEVRNGTITNN